MSSIKSLKWRAQRIAVFDPRFQDSSVTLCCYREGAALSNSFVPGDFFAAWCLREVEHFAGNFIPRAELTAASLRRRFLGVLGGERSARGFMPREGWRELRPFWPHVGSRSLRAESFRATTHFSHLMQQITNFSAFACPGFSPVQHKWLTCRPPGKDSVLCVPVTFAVGACVPPTGNTGHGPGDPYARHGECCKRHQAQREGD